VISYSLQTLWHARQRFVPAVLAVAFSALLVALQAGLLLGMFSLVSLPVDRAGAQLWVGGPGIESVDLGYPVRESSLRELRGQPEVERYEPLVQGFALWARADGGIEQCLVIGARLGDDSLGAVRELTPALRRRLTEPGTVAVDESDLGRLGVRRVGDFAEISERRVRVVGVLRGLRGLTGAYVFCSLATARAVLGLRQEQTVYLLARCHDPAAAHALAGRLRATAGLSAYSREELSLRSRLYWLTRAKAGTVLGFAAALGLLVGAVVTAQTMYGATAASAREYAALRALGIPRGRIAAVVLAQTFWVGAAGLCVALPLALAFQWGMDWVGLTVALPPWLLAGTAALTLAMALLSGVLALRSLRLVEPALLLR
jgi:putative ABC transport system permease protein